MKVRMFLLVAMATSLSVFGQTLKVTPDSIVMRKQAVLRHHGTGDGLDIITKNSPTVLASGADLIWGAFYQAQPNNPGLLSLTSYSAGYSRIQLESIFHCKS